MAAPRKPIEQRIQKWHISPDVGVVGTDKIWSPCWLWTGARTNRGYGNIEVDGKCLATHRVSYALAYGGVPEDLVLDHLCSRRACGNPLHLDPVTQKVNVERGASPVGEKMRARRSGDQEGR